MSDKELAPISVEAVAIDDLDSIKVIANADTSKENRAGIGERADAVFGLASNVIDLVEGKQLYKVEVPEGYSLKDLVASKKDPEAVRALVRDPKGRLSGDVSLKATGISPAQIASVGLAAAAMVVGQAYMTEISDSLQRIDAKLESIATMIAPIRRRKSKTPWTSPGPTQPFMTITSKNPPRHDKRQETRSRAGTTTSVKLSIGSPSNSPASKARSGALPNAKKTSNRCLKRFNPTRPSSARVSRPCRRSP